MTLPDRWWIDGMEDEPCDGCGVKPSKHEGHGSYTCQKCYDARWCPECHYDQRRQPHICPTPEQKAEYRRQMEQDREFYAELGIDIDEET